jgi:hypothetical protein
MAAVKPCLAQKLRILSRWTAVTPGVDMRFMRKCSMFLPETS